MISGNFPANMQQCHHALYFAEHIHSCLSFAFNGTGVTAPTETPTHTAPAHTKPAPVVIAVKTTTSPLAKAIAAIAATPGVKVVKG